MGESVRAGLTLDRGLQVLRAFRADRTPLSNVELARRTGLSKATVSRLTATLIGLGFLRRAAGGVQFELAAGALGIGHAYLENNPVTCRANPFLQALADRLDVSVALAVPDRLDMVYIAHGASARICTLRLGVGSLLPMGWTSAGRAWLWGAPAETRSRCIASIRSAAGPRAVDVEQAIEAAFDDLAATGVCMATGEYQRDAYGVALPVRVGRTGTLMAMSCGAIDASPDLEAIRRRVAPALRAAAAAFEALMADVDADP
ncbi:IclR family transcriptional regulator [Cupriavidus necator]|uniref:IclR family transcriptional regulator n=1 Tax=Cupriavidus necator TaxID=106590 RepID=UPI00277D406B|nr:IclR family transcriptional regulator [Cupriavidus necator]MDQ0141324.1 DNA-binding IclR family transcriptional regulator [Cupriavidus necator]